MLICAAGSVRHSCGAAAGLQVTWQVPELNLDEALPPPGGPATRRLSTHIAVSPEGPMCQPVSSQGTRLFAGERASLHKRPDHTQEAAQGGTAGRTSFPFEGHWARL